MKRESENTSEIPKVSVAPPGTAQVVTTPWGKTEKRLESPAPPPIWTRYIDSRLKQFCAR